MPNLRIDNRPVEVPPGATLLDAARRLGIEIPALCFLEGCTPSTSCMVCVVKVRNGGAAGDGRLVPSCAARAEDGMQVESETPEVHEARRAALELLLSDHPGDCIALCQSACPAHLNIPLMLRQTAGGDLAAAAETARAALVLPATLGRICTAPCEKVCRRGPHDAPLGIRLLHRRAGDSRLASGAAPLPPRQPATGKRVAIIGAGPTGLAAAWRLLQEGCGCTLFDDHEKPGGMLRYGVPESRLPREVLDAETGLVAGLGAEFRTGVRIGRDLPLAVIQREFDAVLIATGAAKEGEPPALGLGAASHGTQVDHRTHLTSVAGIFSAAGMVAHHQMAVRAVAGGAAAAGCILQFLVGKPVTAPHLSLTTRMGRLDAEETAQLAGDASPEGRLTPSQGEAGGYTAEEARRESLRCMHCDCRKATECKLRHYAAVCDASPSRHRGTRRRFEQDRSHPDIMYEPGKCIACGQCVQIAQRAGEPLGLAFQGRGFGVRVAAPLGGSMADGLRTAAAECVAACPTGALAFKRS